MSRLLRWSNDSTGTRHNRGRDHAVLTRERVTSEIGPDEKCADRCDKDSNYYRDQLSMIVFTKHLFGSVTISADVFA
jgi:hypothetical protein